MSGPVAGAVDVDPAAPFRLETPRLVLRDWTADDWPAFFRHTNTPAVMRWLGGELDAAGMAGQRRRIEATHARHGHCFWALERQDDDGHLAGELLGFCGLKRADTPGSPVEGEFEIGWRLREDGWGRGYAREAAEAALRFAFEHLAAERVVALTVAGNAPSQTLMRRLGMRRRPELDHEELHQPAGLRHTIVHAIDRVQWSAARG